MAIDHREWTEGKPMTLNETPGIASLALINELWAERPQSCCPYVRHTERGCWCASPALPDSPHSADRYLPCDTASLQLWCLTEDHYTRCHFYPAGDVP